MNNQTLSTRVLVFSLAYFPFIGGAEVALREITQRLPDIQFDLITARFNKQLPLQERIGNVMVYRIGQSNKLDKYLYPLRAFLFARKLHYQHNYQIVWSIMATWAGIAALFFKLKFPNIKYLLTLQSGDPDLFIWLRTWFWYPLYRMIYCRADHIQVISHWLAQRARKYGYQGKISLIPNGVDLNKFKPLTDSEQKKFLRQKLNLPVEDKIIFTSSRLVKKNNLAILIRAIQLLAKEFNLPVKLVIAGSGRLEKKLKRLVSQLGLAKRVAFLGQLPTDKLVAYYQAADIFVRPSLSEGQGISFLEAMACGLPVITTPVGGIPDFLTDKQTGLFCRPDSAYDLADKIKLLFNNYALKQKIQAAGLKLVRQNYNWDNLARRMGSLIT